MLMTNNEIEPPKYLLIQDAASKVLNCVENVQGKIIFCSKSFIFLLKISCGLTCFFHYFYYLIIESQNNVFTNNIFV